MIHIEIPGIPIPWAPSRTKGKIHYNPKDKEKQFARTIIYSQYDEELLRCPVHIDFTFYVPIPKSTSKKKKQMMVLGSLFPVAKPDTTNMQKFYEDCLKGIVIYDDNLVTDVMSRKRYSETPRTVINVIPLTQYQSKDLIIHFQED